jgi:hypothetical protein
MVPFRLGTQATAHGSRPTRTRLARGAPEPTPPEQNPTANGTPPESLPPDPCPTVAMGQLRSPAPSGSPAGTARWISFCWHHGLYHCARAPARPAASKIAGVGHKRGSHVPDPRPRSRTCTLRREPAAHPLCPHGRDQRPRGRFEAPERACDRAGSGGTGPPAGDGRPRFCQQPPLCFKPAVPAHRRCLTRP